MTREEALIQLNLPSSARKEEVEQAYQRMVRRYPPEFQPEKFRQVDEAYRFLTSLPFVLEKLLAPGADSDEVNKSLFSFSLSPPQISILEEALLEVKKQFKMSYIWPCPKKE
jgi:curved DNA-binding protein CbpA